LLNAYHSRDDASNTYVMQVRTTITAVNTIAERLKQAREDKGLTQPGLAERAGVSQGTIGNVEAGLRKNPRELLSIALVLGVEPEWLKTGKGPKHRTASVTDGPEIKGQIPLISWVQAGDWNGAHDPLQPGDAERWLECPVTHSERTYALRVRGDSMTAPHGNSRSYPEGCIIFVDPLRKSPVNGARIIAKLNGSDEVTFKLFKQEDGRIWLQPINPMHLPITDHFKVLGTVIGKWEDE
jgi:SOS-response transcriptional repressor LexA